MATAMVTVKRMAATLVIVSTLSPSLVPSRPRSRYLPHRERHRPDPTHHHQQSNRLCLLENSNNIIIESIKLWEKKLMVDE